MVNPEGTLTAAQLEILEVVWRASRAGATVAEIWQAVAQQRSVTRTTILNQVNRLEKRGWLERRESASGLRYAATLPRKQAVGDLAVQFVDAFFDGSATDLVASLLGSKRLQAKDVQRLRDLLNARTRPRPDKE